MEPNLGVKVVTQLLMLGHIPAQQPPCAGFLEYLIVVFLIKILLKMYLLYLKSSDVSFCGTVETVSKQGSVFGYL